MDEERRLKKYKIKMKQVRETVLNCFAHNEEEAKYVAELSSKSNLFYHLDWDSNNFYFDFISTTPCLYQNYEQAACSEWIRKKTRQGYPYKAVLKGVLEEFEFKEDLAKDMVLYTWYMDGNEKERKIIRQIITAIEENLSFNIVSCIISIELKINEKEAKDLLGKYWVDDEHPLDDHLDYGEKFVRTEYWY